MVVFLTSEINRLKHISRPKYCRKKATLLVVANTASAEMNPITMSPLFFGLFLMDRLVKYKSLGEILYDYPAAYSDTKWDGSIYVHKNTSSSGQIDNTTTYPLHDAAVLHCLIKCS
ncbi:hypothetical protein [Nitrososphaera sp. AFS]|uniref:hypothetical protein n=1 Tax=Nitrososphaera sp. AFS TaxID=2301191 RepID=UPI0013922B56|nr:hypothetical protein [Nitrososphaera sp. AFS]NAL78562.1 hypothetical protein [Nitrososphaera sp. AFS]